MKPLSIALLVIVLQVTASGQQGQHLPGDPNTEREIRRQSERYFDALERRDVKSLDLLLLDTVRFAMPGAGTIPRRPCSRR